MIGFPLCYNDKMLTIQNVTNSYDVLYNIWMLDMQIKKKKKRSFEPKHET